MKTRLLALCLAATLASAQTPVTPYATVEIASFERLQADVSALAADLGQPMLAMGLANAGQFLGSPGLLGIDRSRPIRLLFPSENDILANRPVFVLPLSEADGATYLQSLATQAEKLAEANGLATYRFNNFGLSSRFRVAGGHAVFVTEGAVPDATLTAIADTLAADPAAFSVQGVSATVRAEVVAKHVLPQIDSGLRSLLESVEDAEARAAARDASNAVMDLLRGSSRIAFGLGYAAETGLSVWARLDAIPGSPLQSFVQTLHAPSDRLLPYIGGSPLFAIADTASGALTRQLGPALYKALPTLLQGLARSNGSDSDVDFAAFTVFTASAAELAASAPIETAVALRFDDQGRPVFLTVSIADDPAAYLEKIVDLYSKSDVSGQDTPLRYGQPSTRSAKGVTVHTVPVEFPETDASTEDFFKTFAAYAKDNAFGYEFAAHDGLFFATFGPSGALDAFLDAPAPEPNAPLASVFPDMKNLGDSVSRGTLDYGPILHGLFSFYNANRGEDGEEIPADLLDILAKDPMRIGSLQMAGESSAMGLFRLTPGFFRTVASGIQIMTAIQRHRWEEQFQDMEEDNDGTDFDDEDVDLEDDDIQKLLDEAELKDAPTP